MSETPVEQDKEQPVAQTETNKPLANINLERLLAQLPGNVYWTDCNGIYHGCSQSQIDALKLKRDEFIGKHITEITAAKTAADIMRNDRIVLETKKPLTFEEKIILPDGTDLGYWLSNKIPLFNENGEIEGLLGISISIDKQKKLEASLIEAKQDLENSKHKQLQYLISIHRSITGETLTDISSIETVTSHTLSYLENIIALMPGHVYWLDKNNIFLGCNNNQAQSAGLRSRKEIIGKSNYDMPWKDQAERLNAMNEKVIQTGEMQIGEENAVMVEGKAIFLSQKVPLINKKRNIIGVLGISLDITKQKRLEAELREAKLQADAANALKSEFIQNMEHDIRTPFAGICTMTQFLVDQEKDEKKRMILEDITSCTKELLGYCNSILDFSAIEAGELPITLKVFCPHEIINSIVSIETPAVKTKMLRFHIEIDPNLPKLLHGDQYRLKRILINLVSNAIKFTHEGYIKLQTRVVKVTGSTVILQFIISDTGIGISEDKIEFVYEKFTRLSLSNQGLYKGIGLGLRIVKQFINDLNGEINVTCSGRGQGTTFTCTLPFDIPMTELGLKTADDDTVAP